MNKFYITSAIPYVNAKPHVGHALEFVQADVIARYHHLLGDEVFYVCGADENALKNVQAAEKAGEPIQEFVDKNSALFQELLEKLDVGVDVWQRGSDQDRHYKSSQKLWELCVKNGDIYKKKYKGLYCVGCEQFYEKEELNGTGECFEHPGKKLDEVEEENYFFRLSAYKEKLLELLKSGELNIVPDFRCNEVVQWLSQEVPDLSISRSNERAKNWGVPVPGDSTQRIYVWFDALNIYQSGIGFGWDEKLYKKWWPAEVHVIGKGISRFHCVYWPAFLLSAGLKLPKAIWIHGYYTVNGQKMSKTLGNVYDPKPLAERFGADSLRYFFLAKTPLFDDGDFSEEKFKEVYNADLANGLGNLVARVLALAEKHADGKVPKIDRLADDHPLRIDQKIHNWKKSWTDIDAGFISLNINQGIESVWKFIKTADAYIDQNKPWELVKTDVNEFNWVLYGLLDALAQVAWQIYPYLPETAKRIGEALGMEKLLVDNPNYKESWTNIKPGTKLKQLKSLFPRII